VVLIGKNLVYGNVYGLLCTQGQVISISFCTFRGGVRRMGMNGDEWG
jgi:hypothetical protein